MTPIAFIKNLVKQGNDYLASLPVEPEQSCAWVIEMELAVIASSRTGLNLCSPVGGFRRGWRDAIQWISLGTDKPNHGGRDYEKAPDGVEDEPSRHPLPERAEGEGQATECPNALLPDGPICPRCGGPRAPSGVDGGSWVHFPACQQELMNAGKPSEWAKNAADELWNKLSPYLHLEISGADDKLIISALDAARKTGRLDEYATVASIIFDDRNHVQWLPTKNPNEAVRDAMRHLADRLRIERDKIIGGGAEASLMRSPHGAHGPNTPNKDQLASAPSPAADRGRAVAAQMVKPHGANDRGITFADFVSATQQGYLTLSCMSASSRDEAIGFIRDSIAAAINTELAKAAPSASGEGWRTADKDLPPERVDVLTFCTLRDKYFYEVDFLFGGAWSRRLMAQVTHWHPLPLQPQETR